MEENVKSNDQWKNKKVLVTGASGFKGSWMCAALAEQGADVTGTIRSTGGPLAAYELLEVERRIKTMRVDITDYEQVLALIIEVKPEVIFHLAAVSMVPDALHDPLRAYRVNAMGTLHLLEACRVTGMCSRMLVCSTNLVFGADEDLPEGGYPENQPVTYGAPYDTSKAVMEMIVGSHYKTYGNDLPSLCITRCANVFGYGDANLRRVIPAFITSCLDKKEVAIKHKMNGRQFIHITDIIAGYISAVMRLPEVSTGDGVPTYHFSLNTYPNTPEPFIRMGELADLIAGLYGGKVNDKQALDYGPNEKKVQALNCKHSYEQLKWTPSMTMDKAILEMGEWYAAIDDQIRLKTLINKSLDYLVKMINTMN